VARPMLAGAPRAEHQRGDRAWATAQVPLSSNRPRRPQWRNETRRRIGQAVEAMDIEFAIRRGRSLSLPGRLALSVVLALALVRPWCSLSGSVGSLPGALRALGGRIVVPFGVVAVSVRCARNVTIAPTYRCLGTQPLYSGRSPRCATLSPSQRCSRCAPRLLVLRTSQRAAL